MGRQATSVSSRALDGCATHGAHTATAKATDTRRHRRLHTIAHTPYVRTSVRRVFPTSLHNRSSHLCCGDTALAQVMAILVVCTSWRARARWTVRAANCKAHTFCRPAERCTPSCCVATHHRVVSGGGQATFCYKQFIQHHNMSSSITLLSIIGS